MGSGGGVPGRAEGEQGSQGSQSPAQRHWDGGGVRLMTQEGQRDPSPSKTALTSNTFQNHPQVQ